METELVIKMKNNINLLYERINELETKVNLLNKDNADNHRLIDNLKLQLDNHKRFENHD